MDENIYWLALKSVKGVGDKLFRKLVSAFDTPRGVFEAERVEILKINGIKAPLADEIRNFRDWDRLKKINHRVNRLGYRLIKFTDACYPDSLNLIYDPPAFFYSVGEIKPRDTKAIAIVGSRRPDGYGRMVTQRLTAGLVKNGFTIVSGLAKGIDTIAHKSALQNGGRTISVLGSGLDHVYPYENRNLFDEIKLNGAVISEFEPGTRPESVNFPKRNRVISGLALGVLVIQATEKSGSLITADFALEQNREIFAVPGPIGSDLSAGTNRLIQRGAKLVGSVDDILDELGGITEVYGSETDNHGESPQDHLSIDEVAVFNEIGQKPVHIDNIIDHVFLDTSKVLAILLDLEVKELVYQLPGKYYRLIK